MVALCTRRRPFHGGWSNESGHGARVWTKTFANFSSCFFFSPIFLPFVPAHVSRLPQSATPSMPPRAPSQSSGQRRAQGEAGRKAEGVLLQRAASRRLPSCHWASSSWSPSSRALPPAAVHTWHSCPKPRSLSFSLSLAAFKPVCASALAGGSAFFVLFVDRTVFPLAVSRHPHLRRSLSPFLAKAGDALPEVELHEGNPGNKVKVRRPRPPRSFP